MTMMETTQVIEATEQQIKKLTALYEYGIKNGRVIPIEGLSIEEWLILRSIAGIGASEVATALGKVPAWFSSTPLRLWKEKVGHIIEIRDSKEMRIGRNIEGTIIEEYEFYTGMNIQRVKDKMFLHPEYDFLFANLDGIIPPKSGDGYGILECKNTLSYTFDTWKLKLPTYYFRQAMQEMSVLNGHPFIEGQEVEFVDFAVLILDKRTTEIIRVNKDGEFINQQTIELSKFWQNVMDNIPPEPSVAEYAVQEPMEDSYVVATDNVYKNLVKYLDLSKQIKALEDAKDEVGDEVKKEIGDSESLVYNGEVVATWKAQQRSTIDSKLLKKEEPEIASQYTKVSTVRVFRPKEIEVLTY